MIHAALAIGCLLVGAVICYGLIHTKPVPPRRPDRVRIRDVEVVAVSTGSTVEPIVGYGTVRAKHQVRIVPEVSGRLVFANEDLAAGRVIPQGDLLFEVDPTVYESRVRQAEAEVRRMEASLERADQEMENLIGRIDNAEKMVAIEESDHNTSKRLYEVDHVGTQRDVDMVYQKYLRQKDALIELKSRLSILPHVKQETEAELEAARARLRQATHDLENTKISCPFEARVDSVSAYRSQVVTAHFSIATLTDMSAFELPVGIDPRDLRWLNESIKPTALEEDDPAADRPAVVVRWSVPGQKLTWRGHVSRFERVDEMTRTARLIVEIREIDMMARVDTGAADMQPTLSIGMHCRAELPAEPLEDTLQVSRHAIYDNQWVYVFEPDPSGSNERMGRLARRRVPMLRSMSDLVLVDYSGRGDSEPCELRAGDLVVVSPLIKPVVGMAVRLREESVAVATPPIRTPSARVSDRFAALSVGWHDAIQTGDAMHDDFQSRSPAVLFPFSAPGVSRDFAVALASHPQSCSRSARFVAARRGGG